MAYIDPNKQYLSTETQGLFGNQALMGGQNVNYGGQNYKIVDNGNGTRSFQSVGGNAPSMGDMGSGFGGTGGGFQNLINQQRGEQDAFNKSYTDKVNSQESVSGMAERLGNQYGLPGLQKSALNLTNTLANMPNTQQNATRGFDVNEAQLQKIIASETNKLAPTVQNVLSATQNAQGLVNQGLGYGLQEEGRQLAPYEMQAKTMADRFAREMTGYGIDKQDELSMLLEKMREGVQISENDKNRASQLALQEDAFTKTHDQAWQKFMTDEQIRQYNSTTAKTNGGSNYDILGKLSTLRNTKGTSTTKPSNTVYGPPAPSYAKPVAQATQSPNILSQLGSWFKNLF